MENVIVKGSAEYTALIDEAAKAAASSVMRNINGLDYARDIVIMQMFALKETAFRSLVSNPANKIRTAKPNHKLVFVCIKDLNDYFERIAV
jgi:hypothetical protein